MEASNGKLTRGRFAVVPFVFTLLKLSVAMPGAETAERYPTTAVLAGSSSSTEPTGEPTGEQHSGLMASPEGVWLVMRIVERRRLFGVPLKVVGDISIDDDDSGLPLESFRIVRMKCRALQGGTSEEDFIERRTFLKKCRRAARRFCAKQKLGSIKRQTVEVEEMHAGLLVVISKQHEDTKLIIEEKEVIGGSDIFLYCQAPSGWDEATSPCLGGRGTKYQPALDSQYRELPTEERRRLLVATYRGTLGQYAEYRRLGTVAGLEAPSATGPDSRRSALRKTSLSGSASAVGDSRRSALRKTLFFGSASEVEDSGRSALRKTSLSGSASAVAESRRSALRKTLFLGSASKVEDSGRSALRSWSSPFGSSLAVESHSPVFSLDEPTMQFEESDMEFLPLPQRLLAPFKALEQTPARQTRIFFLKLGDVKAAPPSTERLRDGTIVSASCACESRGDGVRKCLSKPTIRKAASKATRVYVTSTSRRLLQTLLDDRLLAPRLDKRYRFILSGNTGGEDYLEDLHAPVQPSLWETFLPLSGVVFELWRAWRVQNEPFRQAICKGNPTISIPLSFWKLSYGPEEAEEPESTGRAVLDLNIAEPLIQMGKRESSPIGGLECYTITRRPGTFLDPNSMAHRVVMMDCAIDTVATFLSPFDEKYTICPAGVFEFRSTKIYKHPKPQLRQRRTSSSRSS